MIKSAFGKSRVELQVKEDQKWEVSLVEWFPTNSRPSYIASAVSFH